MQSTQAAGFAQYTLIALAAVALGGTQLGGGRGGCSASLLGACCIYLMQTLLGALEVSSAWLNFVYGGLLVAGVVVGAQLLDRSRPRGRRRHEPGASRLAAPRAGAPARSRWSCCSSTARPRSTASAARHVELDARRSPRCWGSPRSGQTLVLILGGLDLSVPGLHRHGRDPRQRALRRARLAGAPLALALVVVASPRALGAATGWICHRWRIQPLIVTLGIGAIGAGAPSPGRRASLTGTAPPFLTDLTSATRHARSGSPFRPSS